MDAAYLKALAAVKEAATREMDRAQRGEKPSAGLLGLLRHEFTGDWMEARRRHAEREAVYEAEDAARLAAAAKPAPPT